MHSVIKIQAGYLLIGIFLFSFPLFAQDAQDPGNDLNADSEIKTVNGLNFNVAKDRPIEKKNSIVAPMQVDQYVAMKFSKLEPRLQEMENRISRLEAELSSVRAQLQTPPKTKE